MIVIVIKGNIGRIGDAMLPSAIYYKSELCLGKSMLEMFQGLKPLFLYSFENWMVVTPITISLIIAINFMSVI